MRKQTGDIRASGKGKEVAEKAMPGKGKDDNKAGKKSDQNDPKWVEKQIDIQRQARQALSDQAKHM